ncbi:MAG: ABC-type nickel/cobalt efflux system permease component RcnA [Acidimicrobiales bacterium]|jgi:ABC-type nickel/cobalt efflux system permease component RcnA
MTWALLLTSLGFGLRHGFDIDHIAAIADLTGAAQSRRRGFVLSMLYSVGHGVVVFGLGVIAIVAGAALPASVDAWMERIVGLTLIALGVTILVDFARNGRNFRLQSRWMLVINGTFAGIRRVKNATSQRSIVVEHEHHHSHINDEHEQQAAHDHAHVEEPSMADSPALVSTVPPPRRRFGRGGGSRHAHAHAHALALPDKPGVSYGHGTATGIGMMHGLGVESPTQIAVFVASTAIGGVGYGLVLLGVWVVGLMLANAVLALIACAGFLSAERSFVVYATLAVVVAIASIGVGAAYVVGIELV